MRVHRFSYPLSAAAAIVVLAGTALGQPLISSPIALTDRTDALGPNQGLLTFVQLNNATPVINASGKIAFRGQNSVMADNGNNGLININRGTGGLWTWSAGVSTVRAQIGDPTPDALTYLSGGGGGFINISLADNDSLAYANAQTGTSSSASSNYVQSPGTSILNRMAVAAPGAGGATFSLTSAGGINQSNNGQYLVTGTLTGTGVIATSGDANRNDTGVWTGSGGSLSLLYRKNMPLDALTGGVKPDGTPTSFAGVRMGTFETSTTGAFNGLGHYMWRGSTLQGAVNTTSNSPLNNAAALFSNASGSLQAIARTGDMAAGTTSTDNTTYGGFSTCALNNQDRYAFSVGLRVGTATTTTNALYSNHVTGSLQMLARQGTAVPASLNFPAGTLWGTFTTGMNLGGSNHLVFQTQSLTGTSITAGTNSALIMCKPDGSFIDIARKGADLTPALLPGGETTVYGALNDFAVNSLGQVAFLCPAVGTTSGTSVSTLFAYDQYGITHVVAQTGSLFEAAPGDFRTIAAAASSTYGTGISVSLGSGGQDGRPCGLNDSGLLTFALRFTDGSSGVYVTQVPAAGTGALLGLGGLLAARRRRI